MFQDYLSFFPHIILGVSAAAVLVFFGKKIPNRFFQTKKDEGLAHGATAEAPLSFIERVLPPLRAMPVNAVTIWKSVYTHFSARIPREVLHETFEKEPEQKMSWQDIRTAKARISHRTSAPVRQSKLTQSLQEHSSKPREAQPALEEEFWLGVLRQNPRNPHPYKRLGEIYMQRGEYKEAHAAFAYALRRSPEDKEAAALIEEVKMKRNQKV